MMELKRLQHFFVELEEEVVRSKDRTEDERRVLTDRLLGFFSGLAPAIDVAQAAQDGIDRRLATQFSVFSDFFHFIHKKENTLSRIFRGLLDPNGHHGQGSRFLKALLEEISVSDSAPPRSGLSRCRVHTEYAIRKPAENQTDHSVKSRKGSIDIVVEWPSEYWIGIENKPWAGEQPRQVSDYFKALRSEAQRLSVSLDAPVANKRVLLLYLSGNGEAPSTLPDEPEEAARCITVPYRSESSQRSVERWLRRCRERCEADRIRWYLLELEDYIQRSFHRANVSTDSREGKDDEQHSTQDGD